MGKGKVCIGVCCVVTVALFFFMLHLMSSVNPLPTDTDMQQNTKENQESKYDNMTYYYDENPPENAHYGLEKVDENNLEYSAYVTNAVLNVTEILEDLWKHTPRRVVPPVWPKNTGVRGKPNINRQRADRTINIKQLLNHTDVGNETKAPNESLPEKRTVRDLKRLEEDETPESIILKILDDSGQFKIEIKLGSNTSFKRKRLRENRRPLKVKPKFSLLLETNSNNQIKRSELAKNTIINVMANDSVILNEYDDNFNRGNKIENSSVKAKPKVNVTENVGSNTLPVKNSTKHNTTDYENIFIKKLYNINNETTEIYKDKFTFKDKTKSIKHSDTIITDIFEDTKKLSNVNYENITEFYSYTIPNCTDYNDCSTIPMDKYKKLITLIKNETIRFRNPTTIIIDTKNSTVPIKELSAQHNSLTVQNINVTIPK